MTWTAGLIASELARSTYRVGLKSLTLKGRMVHREDGKYAVHVGEVLIWPPLVFLFLASFLVARVEIGMIIFGLILFPAALFAGLLWPGPPAWGAIDLKITLWIPAAP